MSSRVVILTLLVALSFTAIVPAASAAPELPCGTTQECTSEVVWILRCVGDSLNGAACHQG